MQLRSILIFTTQKLLRLGLLLLAVAIFTFVLLSLSPIDPVQAYIGADMMQISPEQRQLIAERWGLDQPMPLRFGDWLGQPVQGNWGTSMGFNQPVGEVIASRFSVSVQMLAIAWLLSGLLGLGLGIVAGALAGTWIDRAIRLYAYTLASSPTFWVALLLLIVFSVSLKVTPICCAAPPGRLAADVTFWQHLHHLLLPALTLSIIGVASITLHTRQKLIDGLHRRSGPGRIAQVKDRLSGGIQHWSGCGKRLCTARGHDAQLTEPCFDRATGNGRIQIVHAVGGAAFFHVPGKVWRHRGAGHDHRTFAQPGHNALDRKSTRLNSSHVRTSRMPSSA